LADRGQRRSQSLSRRITTDIGAVTTPIALIAVVWFDIKDEDRISKLIDEIGLIRMGYCNGIEEPLRRQKRRATTHTQQL